MWPGGPLLEGRCSYQNESATSLEKIRPYSTVYSYYCIIASAYSVYNIMVVLVVARRHEGARKSIIYLFIQENR